MPKKLNRINVAQSLKSGGITVFSPREFAGVFHVPLATASSFIATNLSSGLFQKLRNGFYLLAESNPPPFFLANTLYQPSYVSLEKALAHYGIIPETVYTVTSVTTKPTRVFATVRGTFSYQRIKQEAFAGYGPVKLDQVTVLLADREKALADYLYFVTLRKASLNDRLDLRTIRKEKLFAYLKLFHRPGFRQFMQRLYDHARKSSRIR